MPRGVYTRKQKSDEDHEDLINDMKKMRNERGWPLSVWISYHKFEDRKLARELWDKSKC